MTRKPKIACLFLATLLCGCDHGPLRRCRVIENRPADPNDSYFVRQHPHSLIEYLDTNERALIVGHFGEVGDEFTRRRSPYGDKEFPQ